MKKIFLSLILLLISQNMTTAWGFFAHQRINRLAVYTLPPEMLGFYKYYITYITENAVNPDKRRYAVEGEAPRHYIDVDIYDKMYNDSAVFKMPRYWNEAVAKHTEDTLQAYGIVPWHINRMKYQLTEAFKQKDVLRILRLSADLGHYIGDANVPLHTTENYNGQLTGQYGIHGFWESRLVELYSDNYDFFVGQANYLGKPQLTAWEAVTNAHLALDSVLSFEKKLTAQFSEDKKYTFEERNGQTIKTYSKPFSNAFHKMLNNQVERRMRASVKMVGDFWFTAWVDAGQPDLNELVSENYLKDAEKELENEKKELEPKLKSREHEGVALHQDCCQNNPYLVAYRKKARK